MLTSKLNKTAPEQINNHIKMEIQNLHEQTMLSNKRDFTKKDGIILEARYTVSGLNDYKSEKTKNN